MERIVVDCSVALAWFFIDERDSHADAILQALAELEASVPSLWPWELANGLLIAERRGRISMNAVEQGLREIGQLRILVHERTPEPVAIVNLARRHGLTAYDAAYLDLALALAAPLATKGRALAAAAKKAGVELL